MLQQFLFGALYISQQLLFGTLYILSEPGYICPLVANPKTETSTPTTVNLGFPDTVHFDSALTPRKETKTETQEPDNTSATPQHGAMMQSWQA
jgi:hypothetical protein